MHKLLSFILPAIAVGIANASPVPTYQFPPAPNFQTFDNVTVFQPPASWPSKSTSYGRTLILNQNCEADAVMLSTFTWRPPNTALPYLPIMRSTDGGNTWNLWSTVYFHATNQSGGGSILQPSLYELPQQVGPYPAGTVLLSGNAIPRSPASTNIEVHASLDAGKTWQYVSTVVTSGPPNTANGAPCVWEPFVHSIRDQLIVHYSDQSDPLYGQKLAHRNSKDTISWTSTRNDVTFSNYTLRPGMITMAEMGNNKWIATYEVGNFPALPASPYGVHYTIADSPEDFGKNTPILLKAKNTGTIPSASPFVQWTPAGGDNGTVIVSDGSYADLFLSTDYGITWQQVPSGHGVGYTRSLRVMPDESKVLVFNGGMYGMSSTIVTAGEYWVPGPYPKPSDNTIAACNGHQKLQQ
ncbi:hypothetical protein TWF694_006202 [Orbilia ellipsospora]|uniref:BNR/Asp-box repeat domain protein n=1 Tax=Orbilia ellipsospora TaxID=2528407 RepID=A0AAV9XJT1_9PEZI